MGKTYKTNLNYVILIQKKVIRAICGINDMCTMTSPLFNECGILKFVDLIAYKTLIVMFNVKNNLLPRNTIIIYNQFQFIQYKTKW